jgi:uncharacterized protein
LSETLPSALEFLAARLPDVPRDKLRAALELVEQGAPAAFVARYRRDQTGGLDAPSVRRLLEAKEQLERHRSRQTIVLESIERHATLDPALRERILGCVDADVLEDLYHPYRQQKKNRAREAREAGLGPLADWIWDCGHGTDQPQPGQTLELWAFTFRNEEKGVPDAKAAIEGARDILVERLAGTPELRALVRSAYFEQGYLHSAKSARAKPGSRYESYFDWRERVSTLREPRNTHRYLAVKRGLAEDELVLSLGGGPDDPAFEARLLEAFEAAACSVPDSPGAEVLRHAGRIALKNDVRTGVENEVHRVLADAAHAAIAASVGELARRRLLDAPFGARPVIGVDPGPNGCRLAAAGAAGELLAGVSLELGSDEARAAACERLVALAREHAAAAIAVGDGGGGRELELAVRAALRAAGLELPVALVSEAGATAWGASEAARVELPDAEPRVRAALSLARRLQDPLAELARLEPRALVGAAHHHELPHALLHRALDAAFEDAIAQVGVDANTAPRALLARVPGLHAGAAAAIVEHRTAHGPYRSRAALAAVAGLGEPALTHAAGFLRVRGGDQPLDATAVHPEQYAALASLAERHGKAAADLLGPGAALVRDDAELAGAIGPLAREQVASALEQAGRDPRPAFQPFAFREDVHAIEHLKPGMLCPGVVTNVASFGVFVDVGARQDGLVHVSQLGKTHALGELLGPQPGDRVEVRVLKVDLAKKQISLTMKPRPEARPRPPRKAAHAGRPRPAARVEARTSERPRPAASPGRAPGRGGPPRDAPRRGPSPAKPEARPPVRPPLDRARSDKPKPEAPRAPRSDPRRPAFNNPFAVLAELKKR